MDLATKLKMYTGAREIISDPTHWGKGSYAQVVGNDGTVVSGAFVYDEDANNFCLLGALGRAIHQQTLTTQPQYAYLSIVKHECIELANCIPAERRDRTLTTYDQVVMFNDNKKTTHEDVLKALDCAIDAVKATIGEQ